MCIRDRPWNQGIVPLKPYPEIRVWYPEIRVWCPEIRVWVWVLCYPFVEVWNWLKSMDPETRMWSPINWSKSKTSNWCSLLILKFWPLACTKANSAWEIPGVIRAYCHLIDHVCQAIHVAIHRNCHGPCHTRLCSLLLQCQTGEDQRSDRDHCPTLLLGYTRSRVNPECKMGFFG